MTESSNKTIVKCKFMQNKQDFAGQMQLANDIYLVVKSEDFFIPLGGNLVCTSEENKTLLLWNSTFGSPKETKGWIQFTKSASFDCLIEGFNNPEQTNDLKFQKISFSFPYISDFFNGSCKNELLSFNLDEKFTLLVDFTKRPVENIELMANSATSLNEFSTIISNLMIFFSFALKRTLPITQVYSDKSCNTAGCKLDIKLSWRKITNQDFDKRLKIADVLFRFGWIQDDFEEVVKQFLKLVKEKQKGCRKFLVIIQAYLQNQNVSSETYFETIFLTYTTAIEAYVNMNKNNGRPLSHEAVQALETLKSDYSGIFGEERINNICNILGGYSFPEKIYKCIKQEKIDEIVRFKYSEQGKIKLISDLVNARNSFTHYSSSCPKVDLLYLKDSAQTLLELFILNELKINKEIIQEAIDNNYCGKFLHLRDLNAKYIWLPRNAGLCWDKYSFENYLGEPNNRYEMDNGKIVKLTCCYYTENGDNVELTFVYTQDGVKKEDDPDAHKDLTETIVVNKNLTDKEKNELNDIFKEIYERYKYLAQQNQYATTEK